MVMIAENSKVAIVAPSAQIGELEKIEHGLKYLKSLGFKPVLGKHTLEQYRYMAGHDSERAADINEAFTNPEIKAVFCVRAAAGALRILPYLDYEAIGKNKKPLIGFCDNAALEIALFKKADIHSLNGFLPTYDFKDGELDTLVKNSFETLLKGENITITDGKCRHSGEAEGELICSNLTTLMYLAGTEYFPDLSNKILLLEDVHERMHRIDMMLQQLKQQPNFKRLSGIILGQFTNITGDEEDGTLEDCFADFLQGVNIPVVQDFDFGHTKSRYVLPLGAKVKLNAAKCELKIENF